MLGALHFPVRADSIMEGLHCSGTQTGPSCSKLMMSLVNVLLKFQTLVSEICQHFLFKNLRSFCITMESLFFQQKISVYFVIKS